MCILHSMRWSVAVLYLGAAVGICYPSWSDFCVGVSAAVWGNHSWPPRDGWCWPLPPSVHRPRYHSADCPLSSIFIQKLRQYIVIVVSVSVIFHHCIDIAFDGNGPTIPVQVLMWNGGGQFNQFNVTCFIYLSRSLYRQNMTWEFIDSNRNLRRYV